MRKYLIVMWAALFLLRPLCDSSEMGTLRGVVRDPAGAVVSGAMIRIVEWSIDQDTKHPIIISEKVLYSDRNGSFSAQLAPGLYDIFVSSCLFTPAAKKIRIEPAKVVVFEPELVFDPLIQFIK